MLFSDPQGHYAALGVPTDASLAQIKRAYHARAKTLHPDVNPDPDAAETFLRLTQAYKILSSQRRRVRYETRRGHAVHDDDTARSHVAGLKMPPVTCRRCRGVTAQPRVVRFQVVVSFIFTKVIPVEEVLCIGCAETLAITASILTWLYGWWGVPFGPFRTIAALYANLCGGIKPPRSNAQLLAHQAAAFAALGDRGMARTILEQAIVYAELGAPDLVEPLARHRNRFGEAAGPLTDRWRVRNSLAFFIQLLPIIGGVALIVWQVVVPFGIDLLLRHNAPPPHLSHEVAHSAPK